MGDKLSESHVKSTYRCYLPILTGLGGTRSLGSVAVAERGGFEPPVAFDHTRLPIVHLRPLGHLSKDVAITLKFKMSSFVKDKWKQGMKIPHLIHDFRTWIKK